MEMLANIAIGAMEGRVNIIGEDGQAKPTVLLHYWAWCSLVREILTEGLEKSVLSSSPHHFENINITLGTMIASIVSKIQIRIFTVLAGSQYHLPT